MRLAIGIWHTGHFMSLYVLREAKVFLGGEAKSWFMFSWSGFHKYWLIISDVVHRTSVLRERVAFWWTFCENASLSAHRDYDVAEVKDTGARSILSGCFAKLAQPSSLGPYLARDLAQCKGLVWKSLVFPFWTYGFLGSHGCWELVVTDRETTRGTNTAFRQKHGGFEDLIAVWAHLQSKRSSQHCSQVF